MAKVAFLGLGIMGYPMAGHLAKAGHDVTVFNRTAIKANAWVAEHGCRLAATPADAAKDNEFVVSCVGNDEDLRSVCTGSDGAFSAMTKEAVFIDHTTVSAKVTRELYVTANKLGFSFIDAPISGGQAGAVNGALSVMCGGDADVYKRIEPIIDAYALVCRRIGDSGAGQMTKMCNQIAIAGLVQGLSEALHFAEKAGLDGRAIVEVISQGAAGSWQMKNRYETMIDGEFEHGFAVDLMRKDLGICLDTANEIGAALPVTALVDQFYKDVQNMGGNRWDTSSLIERLRALA
ncbi:MAG: NAD(P)-dependent oxidoreductase [Octadecabacter sp.]|nr:NAD(P)-dependent oxidoreductase [Octadecabacter sp.]